MTNTFSLNRIKLLLRADWIEHYSKVCFHIGAATAGIILYFALALNSADNVDPIRKQTFAFVFGAIGTFIYFCRYIGDKVHRSKGLFLTLPASNAEKYTALLIEGLLLQILFYLIFGIAIFCMSLVIKNYPILNIWEILFIARNTIWIFVLSTLFLSYVTFKKRPFAITVCGYAAVFTFIILIVYCAVKYIFSTNSNLGKGFFVEANPLFNTISFLGSNYMYMFSVATLVVFYVAYLKFKEKELR